MCLQAPSPTTFVSSSTSAQDASSGHNQDMLCIDDDDKEDGPGDENQVVPGLVLDVVKTETRWQITCLQKHEIFVMREKTMPTPSAHDHNLAERDDHGRTLPHNTEPEQYSRI